MINHETPQRHLRHRNHPYCNDLCLCAAGVVGGVHKLNTMNKELFIASIEALHKQVEHDIKVSKLLGEAFPNAFEANLMPDNHYLSNAIIRILQEEMNDIGKDSWIEYFLWELDFGRENYRLKVTQNGKEIPMSTAGELYDFLVSNI
jgi:hypothetical protein